MTRIHKHQNVAAATFALISFFVLGAAQASERGYEHERVVVFGDSLSDPGNAFVLTMDVSVPPYQLIPDAPYARGGLHFSNGPTWVEQLAGELDAERSAGPALRKPLVFSNYAVGGARSRPEGVFDLTTQLNLFLSDFAGNAPDDALYVVYFGGNDIRDALNALVTDPTGATSGAILQAAIIAQRDNLLRLYTAGARRFLIPNAPDLGLVPAVRLQGPAAQGAATYLSANFNAGQSALLDGLQAATGMQIVRVDVFALLNEAVATPAAFGLREVQQPCIVPNTTVRPTCARPDRYLFWDGIHPTRAGHGIIAERAGAALGLQSAHQHVTITH